MTTKIRKFSAVAELPENAKPLKVNSVGAAIVRIASSAAVTLAEIAEKFEAEYRLENRNPPKADLYRLDRAAYIDGYLSYLVSKGYLDKEVEEVEEAAE